MQEHGAAMNSCEWKSLVKVTVHGACQLTGLDYQADAEDHGIWEG